MTELRAAGVVHALHRGHDLRDGLSQHELVYLKRHVQARADILLEALGLLDAAKLHVLSEVLLHHVVGHLFAHPHGKDVLHRQGVVDIRMACKREAERGHDEVDFARGGRVRSVVGHFAQERELVTERILAGQEVECLELEGVPLLLRVCDALDGIILQLGERRAHGRDIHVDHVEAGDANAEKSSDRTGNSLVVVQGDAQHEKRQHLEERHHDLPSQDSDQHSRKHGLVAAGTSNLQKELRKLVRGKIRKAAVCSILRCVTDLDVRIFNERRLLGLDFLGEYFGLVLGDEGHALHDQEDNGGSQACLLRRQDDDTEKRREAVDAVHVPLM
mmetsp:Transcript_102042/g.327430  ORF Transcript_102042/g.327430 Transcript_102042/m.327430 type:complete len:331 (-) Transcript_102042:1876-2868(-)